MALKEESHIYPSFCFYILFKACICGKSINKQSHVICMTVLTSKFTFSNRNLWVWKVFAWVFLTDMNAEIWNNRANGECYQYYIWHSCKGLKKEVMSLCSYLTRKTPKKTKILKTSLPWQVLPTQMKYVNKVGHNLFAQLSNCTTNTVWSTNE